MQVALRADWAAMATSQKSDELPTKQPVRVPWFETFWFTPAQMLSVSELPEPKYPKPHLVRSFKISNDPDFVAKVEDIVGLRRSAGEGGGAFRR